MLLAEAERRLRAQRLVAERLLDHALAIVERSGDAQCAHVAAETAELMRLAWRDAAIGIQDDDAEAGQTGERRAHCRAGVARGGDDDRQRLAFVARAGGACRQRESAHRNP